MKRRPLFLSASTGNARLAIDHFSESDSQNLVLRSQILKRDDYTCQFCEVRFKRHMEVSHLDDDHENNDPVNLATICPLCHQVQHVSQAGYTNGGILISMPMLTQAQINTLSLISWFVIDHTTAAPTWFQMRKPKPADDESTEDEIAGWELRASAEEAFKMLNSCKSKWTAMLSPLVAEPDVLGKILCGLESSHPDVYADREERLGSLKLWPQRDRFEDQLQDWWPELERTRPLTKWKAAFEKYLAATGSSPEELFEGTMRIFNAPRQRNIPSSTTGPGPQPADPAPAPAAARASRYGDP